MIPGIINNLSYCVYNIFRYLEKDYKHLTVLQGRSRLIVAKLRLYHNNSNKKVYNKRSNKKLTELNKCNI